jgi:hypothetical protein
MNFLRLLGDAKKAYHHRHLVRPFLDFVGKPNAAFFGSVQPQELEFLKTLVLEANALPGPIIEIGTLFGFTTQFIANWKGKKKELITVDNFRWNPIGLPQTAHREFVQRILYYLAENCSVQVFEGSNAAFYRSYSGVRPSMIFIDAGHSYEDVMVDITWAQEERIPMISGHDFSPAFPGVRRAVEEAFGQNVRVVGSLWAHIANP